MAAPNNPQVHHSGERTWGLNRTTTCTGPKSGPLRVRIEARQQRMVSGETSNKTWRRTNQFTFCGWENRWSLVSERSSKSGEMENTSLDAQTHPLRNEAQLQFTGQSISLPS